MDQLISLKDVEMKTSSTINFHHWIIILFGSHICNTLEQAASHVSIVSLYKNNLVVQASDVDQIFILFDMKDKNLCRGALVV